MELLEIVNHYCIMIAGSNFIWLLAGLSSVSGEENAISEKTAISSVLESEGTEC